MGRLEKQILIKGRKVLEDATKTELVNGKKIIITLNK